jgi:hypothetical protein
MAAVPPEVGSEGRASVTTARPDSESRRGIEDPGPVYGAHRGPRGAFLAFSAVLQHFCYRPRSASDSAPLEV